MDIIVQGLGVLTKRKEMETGYRRIREAGFDGIDLRFDHDLDQSQVNKGQLGYSIFQQPLDRIQEYYAEELGIIRENGLRVLQAHAPYVVFVSGVEGFPDWAIGIYRQCIRFCDSIGIKRLVIHGISLALDDGTQTEETVREMNLRIYGGLIPTLMETDVVVCMENLFTEYYGKMIEGHCSNADEAIWYIDHLNEMAGKECFGLCMDTGHLNLLGKNQGTYIRKLGDRVKAVHLHDNNGIKDSHMLPYSGNVRWEHVTEALKQIGYSGSLNFEIACDRVSWTKLDADVVPILLRMLHEMGVTFRERIGGV